MPTKLFDGSLVFCQLSKDTAIPSIPENPSPPPLLPSAVGCVSLAFASVNVMPSAPLPDVLAPTKMSKATDRPTPGTAVGQNAEPACQLTAGVSSRLGGDAVALTAEAPFSCHPPDTGEGIVPDAAVALRAPPLATPNATSTARVPRTLYRHLADATETRLTKMPLLP